jgi:hypothetical protein
MRTAVRYYWETDFVIVRTYDEFVNTIISNFVNGSFPETISFDHDLSDTHYLLGTTDVGTWEEYHLNEKREKTGYDCVKFLTEFCSDYNLPLPLCHVHSMNTVGKQNILSWLSNFDMQHNVYTKERVLVEIKTMLASDIPDDDILKEKLDKGETLLVIPNIDSPFYKKWNTPTDFNVVPLGNSDFEVIETKKIVSYQISPVNEFGWTIIKK